MPDLRFFDIGSKIDLDQVAVLTSTRLGVPGRKGSGFVTACAPLSLGGPGKAAFFSDRRYLTNLHRTEAEFVFVHSDYIEHVPDKSVPIISPAPQASWARLASRLYRPRMHEGASPVHPSVKREDGVMLGVGVVIGQDVEIGAGTRIEAYAVIGPGVRIGRDCHIGAHSTIYCALLGDRVQLSSGVRIGEAGFGVSGDARGLVDVPQLGRVILQDDVSIGAGTCVDRGAFEDTIVGEATKIDNMVQIAHNVRIGRNCIVAAHSGLSGSVRIGDGAMFGGRAGIIDHIEIGAGAKVAAGAIVFKDVAPGAMVSGFPAKPSRQFLREVVWLEKNAAVKESSKDSSKDPGKDSGKDKG
ncbi:UDP-3-O-3-hydroxymyristoyl glucosamine N-acyltransferase [Asticcacaulis biprosthecium C19]|uniref:UDP-3-O-acylglucosamine N-acyltransferase n=1 Tax=Asticcacaulis biprosthecium C19 TaxID=715226 RepID=F4QQM5_9CAUL|nr:UDP-3-O-(3-hydroxymyristoyl)glucosamine N-acyltransferase [Asticcacaulis biprosthecium]EGF90512.1 UDP-3-O-3-hydroxymyristoyl glucosamine N-acyltransferase [Asticcacaulis biprosthecium C19]